MLITAKTFDGHTLNSSSYRAAVLSASSPVAQPVFIPQAQADSEYSGAYTVETRNVAIGIEIIDYANRIALKDQLKTWFKRGSRGDLVGTFNDEAADYQLPCVVVSLTQDQDFPQFFTALLQTGETNWRSVSAETDSWGPSGSSGTKAITVGGKDTTRLSLAITPTVGPASGYLYRGIYQLVNVPGIDYGTRPWCMEMDTLALAAQDAHKCQINQGGGIDDSVTTIPFDTITGTLPTAGMGRVDTEQISWTGRTAGASGNLTGVTRGINGTTAAAHADDAEIKVSLVQADLDDLRVWINDVEVKRWIDSPATTTTKIWFNVELKPGFSLVSSAAIADTGTVTYIQFAVNATNQARIKAMPATGIIHHGNEWFLYGSKDIKKCRLYISQRAFLGTTMEAHSSGVTFKYIGKAITITYGNSTIGDPADDDENYDDDKPLFDLNASDNEEWHYTSSTLFHDAAHPTRPGSWSPFLKKIGNETETYEFTANGDSGDPALGIEVGTWLKGTVWTGEVVTGGWSFRCAGGINKVTMTGRKYRSGTYWASKAALQKSVNNSAWTDVFAEVAPPTAGEWAAFTQADKIMAATVKYLRLGIFGSYQAANNAYLQFEGLTGIVYFVSANIPAGALLGAKDNVTLDVTITNTENDNEARFVLPMLLNKVLDIDGESNEITFDNLNAHSAMILNDESRSEIIRLLPGNNDLSIAGTDMGTLNIALSWYKRRP